METITVRSVRLEEQIAEARFACDLSRCKGACCTLPGWRGAPLEDHEIGEIESAFPIIRKYLPEWHLEAIEEKGLYEGEPGNRATTCYGLGACVFVYYQDDIAMCAFERAYFNHEIGWRKPISCHLFPLRVSPEPRVIVRYEEIEPCETARKRGESESISLSDFLQEPLVRRFGEEWYQEFHQFCSTAQARRRIIK